MTAAQFKGYYQGYVANMPVDERVSTAPEDILNAKVEDLATSVDWRTAQSPKGGPAMTPVKDQGGCGSCWAFSATESIESDIAIETGTLLELAPQEFVDCVPNPEECGGTGGCQGATAELAFNYTMTAGQILNKDYTYTAHTGQCKLKKLPATAAGIKSFVKLPINEYAPLLAAVNKQPISISVDASKWQTYEGGVFKGCPTATSETVDIDHAVQLVGYGTDAGTDYFIVRNSWTNHWGEKGCACPSRPRARSSPRPLLLAARLAVLLVVVQLGLATLTGGSAQSSGSTRRAPRLARASRTPRLWTATAARAAPLR